MTLHTSRGLPVPRPRRKPERTLGACAWILAGGQPCPHPAILGDRRPSWGKATQPAGRLSPSGCGSVS